MKSPFVRFSRFVRTPLSIATIGLCLMSGCRHVPGSRRACEERQEYESNDVETRESTGYEESSLTNPINPDATEPPLVSLTEEDSTPLVPREKPKVASSEPEAASQPTPPAVTAEEPTPAAEPSVVEKPPVVEKTVEPEVASPPTAEATPPKRELLDLDSDLDQPRPKKPAPTLKELEDEFFPEETKPAPKLEIPPEPTLRTEDDAKPDSKLKTELKPEAVEEEVGAEGQGTSPSVPKEEAASEPVPSTAAKELASVDRDKTAEALKLAPKTEPVRVKEAVPTVENEVLSLDSYCDGLVFDSQGFGYLSHKDRIVRFSPTGETSVWTTLNSPKGHRIEPEGTHLICDTERRAVLRLSFDGKVIGAAAKECDGIALRAPYDIAVDPKGGFYFTDPGYVQIKNPIGKLHYVDRSGNVSVVVAKLGYPTGLVFDAERNRLLVAESLLNRVVEFRLSEPGKIETHEVFVQLPKSSDSEYHLANLCLDAAGNLYVTQQRTKTVHVFDPQGRAIGRFSTGEVAPSSVALRAPDAAELFFTGELEGRTRYGKVIRLNLGK